MSQCCDNAERDHCEACGKLVCEKHSETWLDCVICDECVPFVIDTNERVLKQLRTIE